MGIFIFNISSLKKMAKYPIINNFKFVYSIYLYIRLKVRFTIKNSVIEFPMRGMGGLDKVDIGSRVIIRKHSWFSINRTCKVKIGGGTRIGRHFIVSGEGSSINIGKNVLMSERVFVTESHHSFEDIDAPVAHQNSVSKGPVKIEDDCWIGIGVCIMPNVTIGKHSIVGANSVVTKDIPPYSVVAGIPARIIRRYNPKTCNWKRVDEKAFD